MPKAPPKKKLASKKRGKIVVPYQRLTLRDLAAELERTKSLLIDATKRLDHLWVQLYTVGLDDRGPIVEDKTDVPF